MPTLYGEHKSDAEVIEFVRGYVADVRANPHDRLHAIMSLVPEGAGKALDYGCGWGLNAISMAEKGNDVTAIDLGANEVQISRLVWGERSDVRFENVRIDDLPTDSFDLVLSAQVIEHVHNVGNYLSGINRVLKRGGLLVISLPNGITPRHTLSLMRGDLEKRLIARSHQERAVQDKTSQHINAWDQFHFVTLMATMGFELERYEPAEGIPFPFSRFMKPYWYIRGKRLRNLSYTMVFRFKKVSDVQIAADA